MRRAPLTALELFQIAALFRRSAAGDNRQRRDQEQLWLAATLIEKRAQEIARQDRARPEGAPPGDLFGLVDLTV